MEVCRLCLDLIAAQGEAKLLDGEARDMVQVVAPELNLDVSDDPLACGECTESLAALFEFKSRCFEHEAEVREKVGERRGELTLRDALAGEAGGGGDRLEEPGGSRPKAKDRLCRTCLAPIECESFTVLQPSEPDAYLSSMLDMCLVEVDLELTKDPVMCENCLENLQKLHHFKSSCQDVEDKIVEYCETHKVKEGDTIELHKVLESEMAMPDVEMALVKKEPDEAGTSGAKVKTEKESDGGDASQGDEDMSDADDELKQEEIDIKSEAGTSDSDKDKARVRDRGIDLKKCSLCPYKTLFKRTLNAHIKTMHDGIFRYICEKCKFKTNSSDTFARHQVRIHGDTSFSPHKCSRCDYTSYCKASVRRHAIVVHDGKWKFSCKFCEYFANDIRVFRTHLYNKHEIEEMDPLKCPQCAFQTTQQIILKKHIRIQHKGAFAYICQACPLKTNSMDTFRKHQAEVHGNTSITAHKCSRCDYSSYKKGTITLHEMTVHDGKGKFTCEFCPYTTNKLTVLKAHLYSKHEVKETEQLQCPHCTYRTVYQTVLGRHIREQHEGASRHKCKKCSFTTNSSGAFRKHQVEVHGDAAYKAYKCSKCDYTSYQKETLKTHEMAVHQNKKKYSCQFCDYNTNNVRMFKIHQCKKRKEKEVEKLKCPHCSFKSMWQTSIRRHMRKQHENE